MEKNKGRVIGDRGNGPFVFTARLVLNADQGWVHWENPVNKEISSAAKTAGESQQGHLSTVPFKPIPGIFSSTGTRRF